MFHIEVSDEDLDAFLEAESKEEKCTPETCQGQCQGMGHCSVAQEFRDTFDTVLDDEMQSTSEDEDLCICMYCEYWLRDKSQELDAVLFHNMTETPVVVGYCLVNGRSSCPYDDTCDFFSRGKTTE